MDSSVFEKLTKNHYKENKMNNSKFVVLTGGLGNQLFQYFLSLNLDGNVYHLDFVADNRKSKHGYPDLFDFNLRRDIAENLITIKKPLTRKFIHLGLRISAKKEVIPFERFLFQKIIGMVVSRELKSCSDVHISSGLGFDSRSLNSDLYIGYFQSYKYCSNFSHEQISLELNKNSEIVNDYSDLARNEKPLLVHYRFSDYLTEQNFGIPSKNYYISAINQALAHGINNKIWVFSDDIELAKANFPIEHLHLARFISEPNCSSAETLQIMRLATSYVIANSTFSWWAATLSRCKSPLVYSPSPWFAYGETPLDLIDPSWHRLDRYTGKAIA